MDALAELARGLVGAARERNERRLLVLSGDQNATRDAAERALSGASLAGESVTYVGSDATHHWEQVEQRRAGRLLGTTRDAVVFDAHGECRPNALGRTVGTVDGGGLFVLLAPPLQAWGDHPDSFDEALAVPPFSEDYVSSHFRTRLASLLESHPGVAIASVSSGGGEPTILDDGDVGTRAGVETDPPRPPEQYSFPGAAYDACLTGDQADAVACFENLREQAEAVVVEADRGRGKSSAAGLAAAALAADGRDVLVTAPQYRNAAELFARADELLDTLEAKGKRDDQANPQRLETDTGVIRYEPPTTAVTQTADVDVVFVDEAAALPVRLLEGLLAAPAVGFTTTVHGYEGTGRGFSVRFRDRLEESEKTVTDCQLHAPIRYGAGDPVESWAFRALLLDARPPVDQLVADAAPGSVGYRRLETGELLADEHLLREVFGLLVLAHYRTEPNDLARLLDAPNVSVRALTHEGNVVSVALLAREGGLDASLRAHMYEGGRVRGNMLPDVLTSQLRDEEAAVPAGQRVMRIATHHAVRDRGLGSRLLSEVEDEFADAVDWLGTGFGATPGLVDFWRANGYRTVHLSTTRNDASGEYSAIMLNPTSDAGRELHDRHAGRFVRRIGPVLSDPLDDADLDVVRAVLRSVGATRPLDLTDWEWRLVAGTAHGASIFDTAPGPFRRLAVHHLTNAERDGGRGGERLLSPAQERLLVRKVLQARAWPDVADEFDFASTSECMRTLGGAVDPLVSHYGADNGWVERERFE